MRGLRRPQKEGNKRQPWEVNRPDYYVQTGSMFENPHGVDHSEIVRFILNNPAEVVAQVVFGKYVESSGLVFTGELIQKMIDRTLPVIRSNTWIDSHAAQQARTERAHRGRWGQRYHTGIDFARLTDYTVISTLDCSQMPARLVYWKRLNRVPWSTIYAEVGLACHLWGPRVFADSTGMGGDVVMDALWGSRYCHHHHRVNQPGQVCRDPNGDRVGCRMEQYISLTKVQGYDFTTSSKKQLVEHTRNVLSVGYDARTPDADFGWVRIPPIPQLEEEMAFYTWDDKKLQTDCLFSLALALWSGIDRIPRRGSAFGSIYGD